MKYKSIWRIWEGSNTPGISPVNTPLAKPIASKFSNEINPKNSFFVVFELLIKLTPIESYSIPAISETLLTNSKKLKLLLISLTI